MLKITVSDREPTRLTAGELQPGDCFVRNELQHKPASQRAVYMMLQPHSRLRSYYGPSFSRLSPRIAAVHIGTGRIYSIPQSNGVLKLEGELHLAVAMDQQ